MAATRSSELLREATRGFLAREAPLSVARAGLEMPRTLDRAAWARAAQMGWIATLMPEEHGGLGVDWASAVTIAEELGRGLYGGPFLGCALAAAAWPQIAGLADGETTAAWCELAAPGDDAAAGGAAARAGNDASARGAAARNGALARLSGVARHVFDADVADVLVVATPRGTYLVDAAHAQVEPERGLDLTRTIS